MCLPNSVMCRLLLFILLTVSALSATAQDRRVITPVKPETNVVKPPEKGTSEETIQQYIKGDTLTAERKAREDSIRRSYHRYPRLTSLDPYVSFLDLILMACGQDYGSFGVGINMNMWNRLIPTAEIGLGRAKTSPADMNGVYRGKVSPYFKAGAYYNFLFKKAPDYQILVGAILGYSPFRYEVTGITESNSYWKNPTEFDITGQKASALWGEVAAGIKVKLAGHVSMGWNVRYHFMLHSPKSDNGRPWFIPGYGTRSSKLAATAAIYYSF